MPDNPQAGAIEAAVAAFKATPKSKPIADAVRAAVAAYEGAQWSDDMAAAPRDRRIMVGVYKTGETFIVRWMTSLEEGDGQWIIARALGTIDQEAVAFVCRDPDCWRLPPPAPGG